MIYLAVSVTNGCGYCIASHSAAARKAGMTDAMFGEVMAVTGMANETNRLANGYRVPIDKMFEEAMLSGYHSSGQGSSIDQRSGPFFTTFIFGVRPPLRSIQSSTGSE